MEKQNSSNQPAPTTITIDDKTLGIIAHIGGLVTSFVAPLLIWLMQKDKTGMAREHALEALNFQITVIIASMVAMFLTLLLVGVLLYPLIFLADLFFSIQGAIAASEQKPYKYPFSLRLFK